MKWRFFKKPIRLKQLILFDLAVLLVLMISSLTLDLSLTLGKFHGLVFSIFTMYSSFAIFIINAIISLVNLLKHELHVAKQFVVAGMITLVTGFVVAMIGGRLFMI